MPLKSTGIQMKPVASSNYYKFALLLINVCDLRAGNQPFNSACKQFYCEWLKSFRAIKNKFQIRDTHHSRRFHSKNGLLHKSFSIHGALTREKRGNRMQAGTGRVLYALRKLHLSESMHAAERASRNGTRVLLIVSEKDLQRADDRFWVLMKWLRAAK